MSKTSDDPQGAQLTADLKKMKRERSFFGRTCKAISNGWGEVFLFARRVIAAAFAVGVGSAGVLAEVHATKMVGGLYRDAVIVSGVCAAVTGMALLYVALMKIGKN